MDTMEIGRGSLGLTLDAAALDRQAAALETRLKTVFSDMGRDISARFPAKTAPVTRALADWESQADRLSGSFSALGGAMGSTLAIAIAPATAAMNDFMTSVVETAGTFRSFVYSLLGKGSSAAENAAGSLASVGTSAASTGRKVSGAARQVKRSLMAFDQINKLTASGSSGSGSSSGSRRSTAAGLWDEGPWIEGNPFGEYLRSLLDDRKFYEAGAALAAKCGEIIDGLDAALNAESFRARLKSSLSAATETVNGFLEGLTFTETDRRSVAGRFGGFVGDALGLGLETIHLTLTGLRWEKLGQAVAQFVNGALASLRERPVDLGTVLSDWLNAKMASLDGFLAEVDWEALGDTVARNINNWFGNVDWELAGRTLRDGIVGLRDTVLSAIRGMDIRWSDIISAFGQGLLGEDHPVLSRLLFGGGITVPVSDVTDGVPKRKKTLGDFTAQLAAWTEGFIGQARTKRLDFTAGLVAWRDSLPGKVLDFLARLTSWRDALSGKVTDFQARLTSWRDALSGKVTDFQARLTSWKEALSGKATDFQARLTSWRDALSGKTVDFLARLTSWKDALRDKTITFTASITSFVGNLTGKLKSALGLKAGGGVYAGGSWRPIRAYASGGSPGGGQLFVAREAGPELVGTLGGHTAVMNNDQIVASVSAGVARAVGGVRFYSRDAATPHLVLLGQTAGRSEEHLAVLAQRAASDGNAGGTAQVVELLRQILAALAAMDLDVKLDGASVKDRVVALINAHTQATGVCEIVV